jgi:hypothetical protein
MSRRSYVPPIEIKVGQDRIYQRNVDRNMTCKFPGCKRWRVDGTTKYCPDHAGDMESMASKIPVGRFKKYKVRYHAGVLCLPEPGSFRRGNGEA